MATSVWRAMAGNPVRFILSRWPWRSLAYVVSSVAVVSIAWLAVMPLLLLVGIPIGALERPTGLASWSRWRSLTRTHPRPRAAGRGCGGG